MYAPTTSRASVGPPRYMTVEAKVVQQRPDDRGRPVDQTALAARLVEEERAWARISTQKPGGECSHRKRVKRPDSLPGRLAQPRWNAEVRCLGIDPVDCPGARSLGIEQRTVHPGDDGAHDPLVARAHCGQRPARYGRQQRQRLVVRSNPQPRIGGRDCCASTDARCSDAAGQEGARLKPRRVGCRRLLGDPAGDVTLAHQPGTRIQTASVLGDRCVRNAALSSHWHLDGRRAQHAPTSPAASGRSARGADR